MSYFVAICTNIMKRLDVGDDLKTNKYPGKIEIPCASFRLINFEGFWKSLTYC